MFQKRVVRYSRRFSSLSHIPGLSSFPYIGSSWQMKRLKAANGHTVDLAQAYDGYPILHRKYGFVYTMGIPGIGIGSRGLIVVCTDPREYIKVLRNEGRNPFGFTVLLWSSKEVSRRNNWSTDIFSQGEDWRRVRTAFQKELLSPSTIKGYLPGICKAADISSTAFEQWQDQVDWYTSYCSFDMFSCVAFGRLMKTSTGEADEQSKKFCKVTMDFVNDMLPLMLSTHEIILNKLGWTTSRFNRYNENVVDSTACGIQLVHEFLKRRDRGELDEFETNSYIAANLRKTEKDGLTVKEFKEMTSGLLAASIDTTSGVINWVLIHLALYPKVQGKVRGEILSHMKVDGGSSDMARTLAMGANRVFPYLSAVIREVHRVRPAGVVPLFKTPVQDIHLAGYHIPQGTPCWLDIYSIQNDPSVVENCDEFLPERWLPEAVEKRKGTPAEVIDHPLLKEPFSAGARKCPGSRVARQEVYALVATLVRKYSFTLAPDQGINSIYDIPYYQGAVIQPAPMPKFIVKKLPSDQD